jgi:hypothetical protein
MNVSYLLDYQIEIRIYLLGSKNRLSLLIDFVKTNQLYNLLIVILLMPPPGENVCKFFCEN